MRPYEGLKNDGFSIISNGSIRTKIIDIYNNFSLNQAISHVYQRCYGYDKLRWMPIDGCDSLRDDAYFMSLVGAKKNRLERFIIPAIERAEAAVKALLSKLDEKVR